MVKIRLPVEFMFEVDAETQKRRVNALNRFIPATYIPQNFVLGQDFDHSFNGTVRISRTGSTLRVGTREYQIDVFQVSSSTKNNNNNQHQQHQEIIELVTKCRNYEEPLAYELPLASFIDSKVNTLLSKLRKPNYALPIQDTVAGVHIYSVPGLITVGSRVYAVVNGQVKLSLMKRASFPTNNSNSNQSNTNDDDDDDNYDNDNEEEDDDNNNNRRIVVVSADSRNRNNNNSNNKNGLLPQLFGVLQNMDIAPFISQSITEIRKAREAANRKAQAIDRCQASKAVKEQREAKDRQRHVEYIQNTAKAWGLTDDSASLQEKQNAIEKCKKDKKDASDREHAFLQRRANRAAKFSPSGYRIGGPCDPEAAARMVEEDRQQRAHNPRYRPTYQENLQIRHAYDTVEGISRHGMYDKDWWATWG